MNNTRIDTGIGHTEYFDPAEMFICTGLFMEGTPVWTGLDRIQDVLIHFFMTAGTGEPVENRFRVQTWMDRDNRKETIVSFQNGFCAENDHVFPECQLAVGAGSVIEPGVVIKPPLVIGRKTELRQGAYLRGGVIIGNHCTVGHATEVKTAVFMNHTEAGHFAYIGDSILGSYVNLGAGTRLANLPFRTLDLKKQKSFTDIIIPIGDQKMHAGRTKFGAVLGDGVETGCNAILAPGCLIGCDTWIYPGVFVRNGRYPARSIIKNTSIIRVMEKK